MEAVSAGLICSIFPGGYAVRCVPSFAAHSLFCAVRSQSSGFDLLSVSNCQVGDLKRASSECGSAARNLMQAEVMNLTEHPHHLSDRLSHCQCPCAASGGSVCVPWGKKLHCCHTHSPGVSLLCV